MTIIRPVCKNVKKKKATGKTCFVLTNLPVVPRSHERFNIDSENIRNQSVNRLEQRVRMMFLFSLG